MSSSFSSISGKSSLSFPHVGDINWMFWNCLTFKKVVMLCVGCVYEVQYEAIVFELREECVVFLPSGISKCVWFLCLK